MVGVHVADVRHELRQRLSFQMMLHDGTIITANSSTNRDLFWAVRGGIGGNFGVLLKVTYRVYVIPPVWGWTLAWLAAQSGPRPVLSALQAGFMRRGASPRLGYMANRAPTRTSNSWCCSACMSGRGPTGSQRSHRLQQMGNRPLLVDHVGSYAEMDDYLDDHPFLIPDVPNQGTKEAKQAGYIDRTLTPAEWQSIIDYYVNTTHLPFQTAMIQPYGGAISAYGPHDSSFFHRNVDMDFFVDVFWVNDNHEAPAKQWLAGYFDLVTLIAIRKKYDPKHVFTFPQCIQPYAGSDQADDTPVVDRLGIDQSIVT